MVERLLREKERSHQLRALNDRPAERLSVDHQP